MRGKNVWSPIIFIRFETERCGERQRQRQVKRVTGKIREKTDIEKEKKK